MKLKYKSIVISILAMFELKIAKSFINNADVISRQSGVIAVYDQG